MKIFERIHNWHQTKVGLAVFGLVELAAAYVFVSWAIDKGSLWDYLCALILLAGFVQNFIKLVRKMVTRDS